MTTIATGLTWCAFFSCHYFQSTHDFAFELDALPEMTRTSLEFGVGPWLVQNFTAGARNGNLEIDVDDECVSWSEHEYLGIDDIDSPMVFARFMIMISLLTSLIFFFVFLCGACLPLGKTLLKITSITFMVLAVMMMLSLVSSTSIDTLSILEKKSHNEITDSSLYVHVTFSGLHGQRVVR